MSVATTRAFPPPDRAAVEAAIREAAARLDVRAYLTADFMALPEKPKRRVRKPKK
jgi:hypothetical protein